MYMNGQIWWFILFYVDVLDQRQQRCDLVLCFTCFQVPVVCVNLEAARVEYSRPTVCVRARAQASEYA